MKIKIFIITIFLIFQKNTFTLEKDITEKDKTNLQLETEFLFKDLSINKVESNNLLIKQGENESFYNRLLQIKDCNIRKIDSYFLLKSFKEEDYKLEQEFNILQENIVTLLNDPNIKEHKEILSKPYFTAKDFLNNKMEQISLNNEYEIDNQLKFFEKNYKYIDFSPFLDFLIIEYLNKMVNEYRKNYNLRALNFFLKLYEENSNILKKNNNQVILVKSLHNVINKKLELIKNSMLSDELLKLLNNNNKISKNMYNLTMPRIFFEDHDEKELVCFLNYFIGYENEPVKYFYVDKNNNDLTCTKNIENIENIETVEYIKALINNPQVLFLENLINFINEIKKEENREIDSLSLLYLILRQAMEFTVDKNGEIFFCRYFQTKNNDLKKKELIETNNIYNFVESIYNICLKERHLNILTLEDIYTFCKTLKINNIKEESKFNEEEKLNKKEEKKEEDMLMLNLDNNIFLINFKDALESFDKIKNNYLKMKSNVILEINSILNQAIKNKKFILKDIIKIENTETIHKMINEKEKELEELFNTLKILFQNIN